MPAILSTAQKPNTLTRIFKETVQRIACDYRQLSSFCTYIIMSDRLKKVVVWTGKNCLQEDILLAQSIARKIIYSELKLPSTSDLLIVHEAGEVLKGSSAKIQDIALSKSSLSMEKAFADMMEILWVDESEYFECSKKREKYEMNTSVVLHHLLSDAEGKFILVEIKTFSSDGKGVVPKITAEHYLDLTNNHVAVLRVGDEWDVWFGLNVPKEVALLAKTTIAKISIDRQTEHAQEEALLFGRNLRLHRQGTESILFRAHFVDGLFPNDFDDKSREDSCVGYVQSLVNCFPKGETPLECCDIPRYSDSDS